ncbi:hypothetical protein J3R82DRAFT_759 [Butyriboletus roseoflavus]|nr:hypothetical protein J3R82DRAFT_759 [Butyriboletus roseoflavus]
MSSTPAAGTPISVASSVSSNAPLPPSVPPSYTPSSSSGVNSVSLLTSVTTSPTAPVTTSALSNQSQNPSLCVHIQLLRLLSMNHSQCFHDDNNSCGYYHSADVGRSIRAIICRFPNFGEGFINVLFRTVRDNRYLEQRQSVFDIDSRNLCPANDLTNDDSSDHHPIVNVDVVPPYHFPAQHDYFLNSDIGCLFYFQYAIHYHILSFTFSSVISKFFSSWN